jgi:hypothetical protein
MSRGYAEGSAIEERLAALERGDDQAETRKATRAAVYAATPADPERHFIGWADEIDADELFRTGEAWGIQIRRVASD